MQAHLYCYRWYKDKKVSLTTVLLYIKTKGEIPDKIRALSLQAFC